MRLNQKVRDAICRDLIDNRFSKEVEKLTRKRARLAKEVYRKHFGTTMVRRMNDLPEGWLKVSSSISVNMGGQSDFMQFNGVSRYNCLLAIVGKTPDPEYMRFPQSAGHATFEQDSPICQQYRDLRDETDVLHKTIHEVRGAARATLNLFTSPNKLIEAWPEVEPFLRKHSVAPTPLPVAPRDALNKSLGLSVAA